MKKHVVQTCPDDADLLAERLDHMTEGGAHIINVIWQPRRAVEADQVSAFDTSGSFLIIAAIDAPTTLAAHELAEDAVI